MNSHQQTSADSRPRCAAPSSSSGPPSRWTRSRRMSGRRPCNWRRSPNCSTTTRDSKSDQNTLIQCDKLGHGRDAYTLTLPCCGRSWVFCQTSPSTGRGCLSCGMILCASSGNQWSWAEVEVSGETYQNISTTYGFTQAAQLCISPCWPAMSVCMIVHS